MIYLLEARDIQSKNMSKTIRILAFGDSLTAGYYQYGLSYHPYTIRLSALLSSIGASVQIDNKGISGEQVVPWMVQRLERALAHAGPEGYDWTIILGGTNDLAYRRPAERIFHEGLKLMYDQVLRTSSQLVVMTVIENGIHSPDNVEDKPRQDLNVLIRDFAATHAEKHRIHLVDLAQAIPYHSLPNMEQQKMVWDDAVHLTPYGYDQMAENIFRAIQDKLKQP